MPDAGQVHVDAVLSQFAIQYRQEQDILIADQCSPPVKVKKDSDKYIIYTKKDRFTIPDTRRADGARAKEVDWTKETEGTYVCENYSLQALVTDQTVRNADKPITPKLDTQQQLMDLLMLDREKRVADQLFSATTFASYYSTLGTSDQWDNYTSPSSDPLEDAETAKDSVLKNSMKKANICILGYEVYLKLRHHPLVIDRVKGGATTRMPAVVGEAELAQVFDVDKVLVGRAVYNSENIGQTASYGYVWGKYALFAYINPSPMQIKNVTCALSPMSQDWQTEKWRDATGRKGEWVQPEQIIDEIVPCDACGYLFDAAVS